MRSPGLKTIFVTVNAAFTRRAALFAALASLNAWASAGPARAQAVDAHALLLKHRAFVGWQLGDGTFRSLRLTAQYADSQGKATRQVSELHRGLLYRTTTAFLDAAGASRDEGFTGSVFWSSNVNGFTTPAYGELAKFRFSYALLEDEGTTALDAVARGEETVDGTRCETLRLDVPHADPIDVDVDPATGAYLRAVVDPDGAYETVVRILSYQDVLPGKRLASALRIGDSDETYRVTKVEPNVAIADDELHPPPPRATWTFAAPQPFAISVTATRVLVDASVNGVKGRFILDTGANGIFLNERFADAAKVTKLGAAGAAVGLYGGRSAEVRRADRIVIGGNTLSNAIVESEDFNSNDVFGLDRRNYDGLLGYDLFAGAIVRLDFYATAMTIADPATTLPETQSFSVAVDTSQGVPMVPMTLNRSIGVRAMLDTGDPSGVVFGPDILYRYHLRMARNIGIGLQYGSVECGNLDTLELGPITYAGEVACKLDSPLVAGKNVLVGLDFLRNFDLLFDYPHGRIAFGAKHR